MSRPIRSECAACHEHFSSVAAFDFHRVGAYAPRGRRRCLTALELLTEGMILDEKGCWDFDPAHPNRPNQAVLVARYGQGQQVSAARTSA